MGMTRDEVLAEMEASFSEMTEKEQNEVLFNDSGVDWSPSLLLAEVRGDTEIGREYVKRWSESKEANASLLAALLGGGMTCGDPDCQNCHGEVRPFDATGTDDGPTIH